LNAANCPEDPDVLMGRQYWFGLMVALFRGESFNDGKPEYDTSSGGQP
jgi:hypothetical protein